MKRFREKPEITLNTVVQRDPAQEFSKIDDEVVMLSLKNGEYYALDPVGSRIWELLEKPQSVQDLIEKLIEEFDVNEEVCKKETVHYLCELKNKELLK